MGKGFTPLSEIDPAVCSLALPEYVDASRVGINMGRISALATIGHLKDVRISGYYGDTTSYTPTVEGYDSQGAAYMGAVGVNAAELGESTLEDISEGAQGYKGLRNAHLKINMAEVQDRVSQAGLLHHSKAWAPVLDKAVSIALRDATWRHLTKGPIPNAEKWLMAIGGGSASVLTAALFDPVLAGHYVGYIANTLPFAVGIENALRAALGYFEGQRMHPKEICWSLLPARHYDRAAAVSGLSRVMKLAKAL